MYFDYVIAEIHSIMRLFVHYSDVIMSAVAHGLNCSPGPCEGVAGAMSASRVVCKVVQFTVKQRQLHVNICNGDAS